MSGPPGGSRPGITDTSTRPVERATANCVGQGQGSARFATFSTKVGPYAQRQNYLPKANERSGVETLELAELVAKGKQQGYLTTDDILQAVPHPELHVEEIEEILEESEATLVDDDAAEEMPEQSDTTSESEEEAVAVLRKNGHASPLEPVEDAVRLYLRDISPVPLLTAADEVTLAMAIERAQSAVQGFGPLILSAEERASSKTDLARGNAARKRLTESNLRLVVSIAKKYHGPRPLAARPDSGGQHRPDQGRGEVRLSPRLQVLHLCHLVDSPGDHPGHRRSGAHDSHSGAHGRDASTGWSRVSRRLLQELGREPR